MEFRRTFLYSSLLKNVTTVQKEINYCSTKRDEVVFEDKTFCHDSFQNSSLAEIKHCSAKRDEVVFEDETFCYDSFQNFSLAVIPGDGQLYQIKISDEKWKSVIDELTENQKKCFYEKINSPLKYFCKGFPSLIKNLDQGERLDDIVNHFQLPENDRIMILLANCGGGNPTMSVFEELKHSKPHLEVKDLCKCLETLGLNHALEFLKRLNYSDEVKISNISKIDLTNLSYKLISFNANVKPWKDVAHELCNSKEDVNRVAKTVMLPNQYSPTEKLFEILSMRTSTTIQDFLMALKSCNVYDAYELMCQSIITEIQNLKCNHA